MHRLVSLEIDVISWYVGMSCHLFRGPGIEKVRALDEKRLRDAAQMDTAAVRASKRQPLQLSRSANAKEGKSVADKTICGFCN